MLKKITTKTSANLTKDLMPSTRGQSEAATVLQEKYLSEAQKKLIYHHYPYMTEEARQRAELVLKGEYKGKK